jgi:hypothetical protein
MSVTQEASHARVIPSHVHQERCFIAPQHVRRIILLRGSHAARSTQTRVVHDVSAVVLRVGRPPGATTW